MNQAITESGCRNCSTALSAGQRFCGSCGQRVVNGRLTFPEIAHDLVHALTHADRSIFSLIGALITRPGRVARDYIEGRRKKYFGPFAFLVITVGIASFVSYVSGIDWFAQIPDDRVRATLLRNFNLVILVQTPLLALACSLLFYGSRLNFSEHLVMAAYTSGMRALLLAFVEVPLRYFTGESRWIMSAYVVLWFGYFAFAAAQFYGGNRAWAAARAVIAPLFAMASTVGIIFVYIYLSIRAGGS